MWVLLQLSTSQVPLTERGGPELTEARCALSWQPCCLRLTFPSLRCELLLVSSTSCFRGILVVASRALSVSEPRFEPQRDVVNVNESAADRNLRVRQCEGGSGAADTQNPAATTNGSECVFIEGHQMSAGVTGPPPSALTQDSRMHQSAVVSVCVQYNCAVLVCSSTV